MKHEQIHILLEKYWEGETTLEEERMLKAYFSSGDVAESLRTYVPLFQTLQAEKDIQYPKSGAMSAPKHHIMWHQWAIAASIAALLMAGAWWYHQAAPDTAPIAYQPPVVPEPRTTPAPIQQEAPAAAPVAAAEKARTTVRPHRSRTVTAIAAIEPEDPQKAYEIIRAALALVSNKINKGTKEAEKNINKIETIDRFIKKKTETAG
jgi:hypothetical protein